MLTRRFSTEISQGRFSERFFIVPPEHGLRVHVEAKTPVCAWILPTSLWIQAQGRCARDGEPLFLRPVQMRELLDRLAFRGVRGVHLDLDLASATPESWAFILWTEGSVEVSGWIETYPRRGSAAWWTLVGHQALLILLFGWIAFFLASRA